MNTQTLYLIATASVILGTVGGMLERFTAATSVFYKIGVILASLGTDLASLGKLFGGTTPPAPPMAKTSMSPKAGSGIPPAALGLLVLGLGVTNIGASCGQPAANVANVVTSTVIPLTNAVCSVAPDSPVGQPFIDVICSFAQGAEQIVATIAQAIAAGGAATTTTAPVMSVRLRIPASSAPAFLASHKGK